MLPQHATTTANLSRYTVKSSDVISDLRVNVLEENSENVLWYKERFLSDDEIVDHLVDSPTSTICWTIHRPKRGWYIRIRCPSFPPGAFISLTPLSLNSPYYTDGALSFTCRTNDSNPASSGSSSCIPPTSAAATVMSAVPSKERTSTETDISSITAHSYPPSPPPSIVVQLPPSTFRDNLDHHKLPPKRLNNPSTRKTEFILTPHSSARVPTTPDSSLFSRAIALFKNNQPSHSCSFTLSSLPPLSPPPYSSNTSLTHAITPSSSQTPVPLHPLVTFHDRTPLLTVHSLTGTLEIDKMSERAMGTQTSFWIAIALTYLGFLEDRESYLAAMND